MRFILFLIVCVIIVLCVLYFAKSSGKEQSLYGSITSLDALSKALPQSAEALKVQQGKAVYQAQIAIAQIINMQDDKRTYNNTVHALDRLSAISDLALVGNIAGTLESLSPQDSVREAARDIALEIQTFFVEQVMHNEALFKAFKAYADGNGTREELTDAQRYFMTETMRDFERAGLLLPADKRAELLKLDKELAQLSSAFDKNIAEEKRTITVAREALEGLSDQFIAALKKSESGEYLLGVDYPTYQAVLSQCAVEDTRMQLYRLFQNRAYPLNKPVLEALLAKRHERAQLVGFESYAAYDIADQMAQSTDTVEQFLR